MRWVEKYDEEGAIKRHNRQPIAYKIKQNEVKFILDEIKKDKTITMEDLLAKVQLKYPNFDITRRQSVLRNNLTRVSTPVDFTFFNYFYAVKIGV